MITFGERLKALREEKQISQRELGQFFNLSQSTIAYYETNKKEPNKDTLQRLADYFHVSVDYLLGRTNDPRPASKTENSLDDPKLKRIIDSLGRASDLDNEDISVIADQVDRLIEYAKKKKYHPSEIQKE